MDEAITGSAVAAGQAVAFEITFSAGFSDVDAAVVAMLLLQDGVAFDAVVGSDF